MMTLRPTVSGSQAFWTAAAVLGALFVLLSAGTAFAESATWHRTYGVLVHAAANLAGERFSFQNPSITVEYHAHMENAATGHRIRSGEEVPVGTRVRFEFEPHVYDDIRWFAVNASYGSPYGHWIEGADGPAIACSANDFVGRDTLKKDQGALYAALSIDPPTKWVANLDGFDCDAPRPNGTVTCTAREPGTHHPKFVFGARSGSDGTFGHMYPRVKLNSGACVGNNLPMKSGGSRTSSTGSTFKVEVPIRYIPMTLKVTAVPDDNNPPTVSGGSSGGGAGSCSVGTPHAYTFAVGDSDPSALVRLVIDWGHAAGGTWVNDGTDIETTPLAAPGMVGKTRTYSTPGSKRIKVYAADQYGARSAERTVSFTCAEITLDTVRTGPTLDEECLADPSLPQCFDHDGEGLGIGGGGLGLQPALSLRATPSLVRSGATTVLTWSAEHVSACSVSASNGDEWDGITSPVGGERTSPIRNRTTYTLACESAAGDVSKTVDVVIIPSWQEQ